MHISVLKNEIVECFGYLNNLDNPIFVDGTLGAAGHALAIANRISAKSDLKVVGIDQDKTALEIARENIKKSGLVEKFLLVHGNFKNVKDIISDLDISSIDGALIDLGVSSMQLDQLERGFSFKDPEQPLDMRMDRTKDFDAKYILANYPEARIEYVLKEYGEEPFAKKIAKNICETRRVEKIEKVGTLLEVIGRSVPDKLKHGKVHFATKTFQALRIEVNSELIGLDKAVYDFVDILNKGSRLAIITFHSLEDRIIKHAFLKLADPCECPREMPCVCGKKPLARVITRKPILPSDEEIKLNVRSRSAKLRIIEKI